MGTRVEGRREMDFPHPTRGEVAEGSQRPQGPQLTAPAPHPASPCGSAPGGMVDSGACQRRVCGLKPRPPLQTFLSPCTPLPPAFPSEPLSQWEWKRFGS